MKKALVLFTFIPIWIFLIAPIFIAIPKDFNYTANIYSLDNFYDEESQKFSGEKLSLTKFFYEVESYDKNILNIRNVFDVRTLLGEKIFIAERLYGIDALTGRHVSNHGDKDRDGFLFAPRHLKKGQEFTYWHINYDGPARMSFVSKEKLDGLTVYHYESRYNGVTIDQTANLDFLPKVPEERGINLDPYLELWIEPVTGRMVKYEDFTTAYYYDIKTGVRIIPWNKFQNKFDEDSISKQIKLAKELKTKTIVIEILVSVFIGLFGIYYLIKPHFMMKLTPSS